MIDYWDIITERVERVIATTRSIALEAINQARDKGGVAEYFDSSQEYDNMIDGALASARKIEERRADEVRDLEHKMHLRKVEIQKKHGKKS